MAQWSETNCHDRLVGILDKSQSMNCWGMSGLGPWFTKEACVQSGLGGLANTRSHVYRGLHITVTGNISALLLNKVCFYKRNMCGIIYRECMCVCVVCSAVTYCD